MGNCLRKRSVVVSRGGGDQWEFLNSKARKASTPPAPSSSSDTESRSGMRMSGDKCKQVRFNARVEVFGEGYEDEELKVEEEKNEGKMEQVRIRIGKKQLEELLEKVELESMSLDEMMSCLIAEIHLKEHIKDCPS